MRAANPKSTLPKYTLNPHLIRGNQNQRGSQIPTSPAGRILPNPHVYISRQVTLIPGPPSWSLFGMLFLRETHHTRYPSLGHCIINASLMHWPAGQTICPLLYCFQYHSLSGMSQRFLSDRQPMLRARYTTPNVKLCSPPT
jgi:hypothetical protein